MTLSPIKQNIIKTFLLLTTFSAFIISVSAQVGVPNDDGETDIVVETFAPSLITNLRTFGILRFIGFLAVLFVGFLLLMAIYTIARGAVMFVRSEGDAGEVEKGATLVRETLVGILISFFVLVVYAVLGFGLGGGNIFLWPQKLAQCHDGMFLFKAEYNAQNIDEEIRSDDTYEFCCTNIENLNEDGVFVSDASISTNQSIRTVAIGEPGEESGWVFVKTPERLEDLQTERIVRVSGAGASGCIPYDV